MFLLHCTIFDITSGFAVHAEHVGYVFENVCFPVPVNTTVQHCGSGITNRTCQLKGGGRERACTDD